jgi:hypothetical protein
LPRRLTGFEQPLQIITCVPNRTDTPADPNYYSDSSIAARLISRPAGPPRPREYASNVHKVQGVTDNRLWTIFVVLGVFWLLGIVTSYTMGGFIHLLLVLAVVVLLIRVLQGRSVVD